MVDDEVLPLVRRLLNTLISSGNPFYRKKLVDAGFTSFDDLTLQEFRERCPFTTKEDIASDHRSSPPFGTNLGKPIELYSRVSRTHRVDGIRC